MPAARLNILKKPYGVVDAGGFFYYVTPLSPDHSLELEVVEKGYERVPATACIEQYHGLVVVAYCGLRGHGEHLVERY